MKEHIQFVYDTAYSYFKKGWIPLIIAFLLLITFFVGMMTFGSAFHEWSERTEWTVTRFTDCFINDTIFFLDHRQNITVWNPNGTSTNYSAWTDWE